MAIYHSTEGYSRPAARTREGEIKVFETYPQAAQYVAIHGGVSGILYPSGCFLANGK